MGTHFQSLEQTSPENVLRPEIFFCEHFTFGKYLLDNLHEAFWDGPHEANKFREPFLYRK